LTRIIEILTSIFNACWLNKKIPADWKHATITLLEKKGGNPLEPSDWRPISLLTSFYKVYMKLIQTKMLPWIVSTRRLSSKQKGSLPRNGLQEHVFCLKSAIENFKHQSTKFFTTFVDIKDAFGSVDHRVMLEAMERAGYPRHIIDITADIYTGSSFQVQAAGSLTPCITRHRGIIQGCPWSAIAFIQALDPWIRWMEEPFDITAFPTPCQAYMDDVCVSAHTEQNIREMVDKTETFLDYTGMEVKHRKCATIHGQRTGNNWARVDSTSRMELSIQGDSIPKFGRDKAYVYLGHHIDASGTSFRQQQIELVDEFQATLDKLRIAPLPVCTKLEAINTMASSKLNFHFSNMYFTEKVLAHLESMIVEFVRENLKLNNSSTHSMVFTPKKKGGLGILKPSTMYHAKRISFLLSVLNCDDLQVRAVARDSFVLHMTKRKVPSAPPGQNNFGGYSVGEEQRILKGSKVDWPRSTFVELNELCRRLGLTMSYSEHDDLYGIAVPASDDGVVTFNYTDSSQLYSAIKTMEMQKDLDYWSGLQRQGRLLVETTPYADMSNSIGHLTNKKVNDHLTRFIAKGRLQLLETNAVISTYYPDDQPQACTLCGFHTDTNSHALNGCRSFKGLYTERHDRCVKIVTDLVEKRIATEHCEVFHDQRVEVEGLDLVNVRFNKPDLCMIDHANSKAFIVELACPYDPFIDMCYQTKFDKYMPLCLLLNTAGFHTKIIVLIIGSLGNVHRRFVPGLQQLGISKREAKTTARYTSISVMIGSRRVWQRRQFMMG
jgi:hypothetical protein